MRAGLLLSFVVCLSIAAPRASAQDGGPPPEYRGIVDSALDEFDAGHWAEARALFERAHAIFPNARTLRGMGMAAFELRDYVAARRSLEASLTETRRSLTDEQRAQVTELVGRARVFVGDFRVGPAPAGSELDVDGVPTTPEGDLTTEATVPLAVGAHEITLRAPDGRSARAQITVHGGENTTLALAITDAAAADVAPPRDTDAPRDATPPAAPPRSDPGAGPWVLLVGGAVIAVAGAVLLGVGASDASSVTNAPRGTDWADLEAPYARATPLEVSGVVALVVGVGCAAGGLGWMLTSGPSSTQVSVGPGSLLVRGTF